MSSVNDNRQRLIDEVAQELARRDAEPDGQPERIVPPRLRGWHRPDVFGNAALRELGLPTEKVARVAREEAVKAKRLTFGHVVADDVCVAIYTTASRGDADAETRAAWMRVAADALAVVESIDRRAKEPVREPIGDEAWMRAMLALEDERGPFPGASGGAGASKRRALERFDAALAALLADVPSDARHAVYCDDAGTPESASCFPCGHGNGYVRLDRSDCGALRITAERAFVDNPDMRTWFLSAPTGPGLAGEPAYTLDEAIREEAAFLGWTRRTTESP